MSANNIGKWSVQAGIDARGMQQGAQQAINSAKGMESALEGIFGRMGAAVKFPGLSIGFENITSAIGLQGGRQLVESFQKTVDENLELGFLNDRLGTNVEWLSGLQTVASEVSINAEQFGSAMNRLNMKIGEARLGSVETRKTFADLGLEWERIATQGFEQNFTQIAQALSLVENRSERARLSQELFGRGEGQRMLRLMEGGAHGLANAMRDVQERGGFITSGDLARMQAADDAMDRVTTALSSSWRSFVATTAPAVTTALNEIHRIMTGIGSAWNAMTGPSALSSGIAQADRQLQQMAPFPVEPPAPLPQFGIANNNQFLQGGNPFGAAPLVSPTPATTIAEAEAAVAESRTQEERARQELQRRRDAAARAEGEREAAFGGGFRFVQTDEHRRIEAAAQDAAGRLSGARIDATQATQRVEAAEAALAAITLASQNARQAENRTRIEENRRSILRDIDEADRITEQQATPLERFSDRMDRLRELFDNGNISAQTFERATNSAFDSLARPDRFTSIQNALRDIGTNARGLNPDQRGRLYRQLTDGLPGMGQSPLLGSLSAGSTEAAQVIQGAMTPQTDRLADIAAGLEALREEQARNADLQERLVDWFESGPGAAMAANIAG